MRFVLSALCLAFLAAPVLACTGQVPCFVGDRSYHLRVPDTWDGVSPLPVLLHFHGWGRQGTLVVQHDRIVSGIVSEDVLVLAPNGLRNTWDFWREGSPDTEFALSVIEDAAMRYPIDRDRIIVSGYSWGSNMAWRFACEAGDGLAAVLAVSGTLPQDITCDNRPNEFRQVYGLDDGVLPFPMGPGGDQTFPVAFWRSQFGCGQGEAQGPWNARSFLTFERTSWECESGQVILDIHPGGHFIPHDWIPLQVADILAPAEG